MKKELRDGVLPVVRRPFGASSEAPPAALAIPESWKDSVWFHRFFFWQCTWAHAYVTRHSSLPGRLLGRPLGRFSVGPSVAPRVLVGRSLVGSSAGSCPCRLRLQCRAPPRRPHSRRRRRLRPRCVNARRVKAASAQPSTAALRRHCELARVPLD